MKISLAAENERTVFQKLREAALAYHLTRRWSKERILRNYLNSIYFGNGAYGIESAARTYFALQPRQAAASRGRSPRARRSCCRTRPRCWPAMVASPSAYDPVQHPVAAKQRRDLVLLRMFEQGYLTRALYDEREGRRTLPTRDDLTFPKEDTDYPYFTSWIKQQVVDQLGGGQQGAQRAFEGGLQVKTTIDSRLQNAAEKAIKAWLPNVSGPRASLVAISNKDGMVRAMVGGDNYGIDAVQPRHAGPAPARLLVQAVRARRGAASRTISPSPRGPPKKLTYILKGGERFTVNNYEDAYAGVTTLADATTFSDNSVYAQVGKQVRTKKVARLARRMGIRTPVSTQPRDRARRPAPGRHAAGHGARLRDVRDRRQADLRHALARARATRRCRCPGPVGIERIDQHARRQGARWSSSTTARKMINKRKKPGACSSRTSRRGLRDPPDRRQERARRPGRRSPA